jgi:hypothetical protein
MHDQDNPFRSKNAMHGWPLKQAGVSENAVPLMEAVMFW